MDETLQKVKEFHGHLCAGLTIGFRAAQVALREIGPHSADEEVVAVVETDMCAVDAIQMMTGCTFGKGNLIHLDYGKNAYTFIRRTDGHAIRIVGRAEGWPEDSQERIALLDRIKSGSATKQEEARYWELQEQRALAVLDLPEAQLFDIQQMVAEVPGKARLNKSITCEECGEPTMETRICRFDGRNLCIPCFEKSEER